MTSAPDSDPDTAADPSVETLNIRALAGLVASLVVGVTGLFILPALQSAFGLTFGAAFGLVLSIELLSVIGFTVSISRLHQERTFG